jgi:hypothetical protein
LYYIYNNSLVKVKKIKWTWLREQETSWYREGMHAVVSRWRKAVDVDGDMWKNNMCKGNIQLYCA